MRRLLLACWLVCLGCLASLTCTGIAQARQTHEAVSIRWIEPADLPNEAHITLRLIDRRGPFPYPRDGVVFNNYERILPQQTRGYYHEYTVPTPGTHTRGARRIISGGAGERYYTADHYRSFSRIRMHTDP